MMRAAIIASVLLVAARADADCTTNAECSNGDTCVNGACTPAQPPAPTPSAPQPPAAPAPAAPQPTPPVPAAPVEPPVPAAPAAPEPTAAPEPISEHDRCLIERHTIATAARAQVDKQQQAITYKTMPWCDVVAEPPHARTSRGMWTWHIGGLVATSEIGAWPSMPPPNTPDHTIDNFTIFTESSSFGPNLSRSESGANALVLADAYHVYFDPANTRILTLGPAYKHIRGTGNTAIQIGPRLAWATTTNGASMSGFGLGFEWYFAPTIPFGFELFFDANYLGNTDYNFIAINLGVGVGFGR